MIIISLIDKGCGRIVAKWTFSLIYSLMIYIDDLTQ